MQDASGLENALVAYDPDNLQKLSLNNVLRCFYVDANGSQRNADPRRIVEQAKSVLSAGAYSLSKEGLSDPKALELWWMLERKRPGAIGPLVALAKKKGDHQADCQSLLDTVQSQYDKAFAQIQVDGVTIDAYDALESLIIAHEGLDTKDAQKYLKGLSKEKDLKEEFKARGVYVKIQQMLQSNKPKDQEMAKAGLEELGKRYPETKYGKLALGK